MSNENSPTQKIYLREGDQIVLDDAEVANLLSKHFVKSVSKLAEVNGCSRNVLCDVDNTDPTLNNIEHFKYHPSIFAIKQKMENETFAFNLLTVEDVSTEFCKLDRKISSTGASIGLLKDNVDICAPMLTERKKERKKEKKRKKYIDP